MSTVTPARTPKIEGRGEQRSNAGWIAFAVLAIVVVAAGALWLAFGGSSVSIEDEVAEIEQMIVDQEAAQNSMDEDAMVAMLTDDAVVHMNDMPALVGGEGLRQAYAQLWPVFQSIDITVSETTVAESGDLAWVHGTHLMELNLPDVGTVQVPGHWVTVLEKIDGEWLVTGLNTNDIAQAPAA